MQWPQLAMDPPDHQLPAIGQINPLQAMADLSDRPVSHQRLRVGSLSQYSRKGGPGWWWWGY